jgi:hypothetical protein
VPGPVHETVLVLVRMLVHVLVLVLALCYDHSL